MKKLICKVKSNAASLKRRIWEFMKNTDGDQITGWLIVVEQCQ